MKNSSHSLAWFALAVSLYCAGTTTAIGDDMPVPLPESSQPVIDSIVEPVSLIPTDNPIGAILLSKRHPLLLRADFTRVSDPVIQIYQHNGFEPIWFTPHRSEKNLQDLITILSNASSDALNPINYDVELIKNSIGQQDLDSNMTASTMS